MPKPTNIIPAPSEKNPFFILQALYEQQRGRQGHTSVTSFLILGRQANLMAAHLFTVSQQLPFSQNLIRIFFTGSEYVSSRFFKKLAAEILKTPLPIKTEILQAAIDAAITEENYAPLVACLGTLSQHFKIEITLPYFSYLSLEVAQFLTLLLQSSHYNIHLLLTDNEHLDTLKTPPQFISMIYKQHENYTAIPLPEKIFLDTAQAFNIQNILHFNAFSQFVQETTDQAFSLLLPSARILSKVDSHATFLVLQILKILFPYNVSKIWLTHILNHPDIIFKNRMQETSLLAVYQQLDTILDTLESLDILQREGESYYFYNAEHPLLWKNKISVKVADQWYALEDFICDTFAAHLDKNSTLYWKLILSRKNVTNMHIEALEKNIITWQEKKDFKMVQEAIDFLLIYYKNMPLLTKKNRRLKISQLWLTKLNYVTQENVTSVVDEIKTYLKSSAFRKSPVYAQIKIYQSLTQTYGTFSTSQNQGSGVDILQIFTIVQKLSPKKWRVSANPSKGELFLHSSSQTCETLKNQLLALKEKYHLVSHKAKDFSPEVIAYLKQSIQEQFSDFPAYQDIVFFKVLNALPIDTDTKLIHKVLGKISEKLKIQFALIAYYLQLQVNLYITEQTRLCLRLAEELAPYLLENEIYCSATLAELSFLELFYNAINTHTTLTSPLYNVLNILRQEFPEDLYLQTFFYTTHIRFFEPTQHLYDEMCTVFEKAQQHPEPIFLAYLSVVMVKYGEFIPHWDVVQRYTEKKRIINIVLHKLMPFPTLLMQTTILLGCLRNEQALQGLPDTPSISSFVLNEIFLKSWHTKPEKLRATLLKTIFTPAEIKLITAENIQQINGYDKILIILRFNHWQMGVADALVYKLLTYITQGRFEEGCEVAKIFVKNNYIEGVNGRLGEGVLIMAIATLTALHYGDIQHTPTILRNFLVLSPIKKWFHLYFNRRIGAPVLSLPAKERVHQISQTGTRVATSFFEVGTEMAVNALQYPQQRVNKIFAALKGHTNISNKENGLALAQSLMSAARLAETTDAQTQLATEAFGLFHHFKASFMCNKLLHRYPDIHLNGKTVSLIQQFLKSGGTLRQDIATAYFTPLSTLQKSRYLFFDPSQNDTIPQWQAKADSIMDATLLPIVKGYARGLAAIVNKDLVTDIDRKNFLEHALRLSFETFIKGLQSENLLPPMEITQLSLIMHNESGWYRLTRQLLDEYPLELQPIKEKDAPQILLQNHLPYSINAYINPRLIYSQDAYYHPILRTETGEDMYVFSIGKFFFLIHTRAAKICSISPEVLFQKVGALFPAIIALLIEDILRLENKIRLDIQSGRTSHESQSSLDSLEAQYRSFNRQIFHFENLDLPDTKRLLDAISILKKSAAEGNLLLIKTDKLQNMLSIIKKYILQFPNLLSDLQTHFYKTQSAWAHLLLEKNLAKENAKFSATEENVLANIRLLSKENLLWPANSGKLEDYWVNSIVYQPQYQPSLRLFLKVEQHFFLETFHKANVITSSQLNKVNFNTALGQFCVKNLAKENLLFYVLCDVCDYFATQPHNDAFYQLLAWITTNFISLEGNFGLNLDDSLRNPALTNINLALQTNNVNDVLAIFKEIQKYIYNLLEADVYFKFKAELQQQEKISLPAATFLQDKFKA